MPANRPHVLSTADLHGARESVTVPPGTLITPAARDLLDSRGIRVIIESVAPAGNAAAIASIPADLAARVDHTLLHPGATEADIRSLCAEAREYGLAAVCVNPVWTATAVQALDQGQVRVAAVVGFPTGAHATALKAAETRICVEQGAQEIDLVANHGWLRQGRNAEYLEDIAACRKQAGPGIILKVIIEAPLLSEEQIVRAATLAAEAGADYVKTSTGVYAQARLEDVALLRRVLPPNVRIKAAGGIRTAAQAQAMLQAGADRIGTSNAIAILWESKTQ
ncbi:MAG TPA: deoxyribose-phosphate aldolase [bacterium]|nr:deoxyribose-phosphate aldolase [bacterium]